MPTRNVVITAHQAEMIDELVKTGRYQNASEVLREGLRLIEQRNAEGERKLAVLRKAAQVGWADIEAGRYIDFETGDELSEYFRAMGQAILAERRK